MIINYTNAAAAFPVPLGSTAVASLPLGFTVPGPDKAGSDLDRELNSLLTSTAFPCRGKLVGGDSS